MLSGPQVVQTSAKCLMAEHAFDLTYTITTNTIKQADAALAPIASIVFAQAKRWYEDTQVKMHYYRTGINSNC